MSACCARKAAHGFDALLQVGCGGLAFCATVNRLTVVPGASPLGPVCVYVKIPCCANGDRTAWLVVKPPGCLDIAKEPKKKSLSLKIGPPTLPPKSLRMMGFLGRPAALLLQLLAFNAVLRKSSNTLPWKSLLPRRVTKLS